MIAFMIDLLQFIVVYGLLIGVFFSVIRAVPAITSDESALLLACFWPIVMPMLIGAGIVSILFAPIKWLKR